VQKTTAKFVQVYFDLIIVNNFLLRPTFFFSIYTGMLCIHRNLMVAYHTQCESG